jgi:hypothetical protein
VGQGFALARLEEGRIVIDGGARHRLGLVDGHAVYELGDETGQGLEALALGRNPGGLVMDLALLQGTLTDHPRLTLAAAP